LRKELDADGGVIISNKKGKDENWLDVRVIKIILMAKI
jgi:hypothetical protein